MGSILDTILEKAEGQLDKATSKVSDGAWFDILVGKLEDEVRGSDLDDQIKNPSLEGIDVLKSNRETLVGLGDHAFALLVTQITSGKSEEAIATYVAALSNADDLIELMNQGSDGVIRAKKELDAMNAAAKQLVIDLAKVGVRYLVPFLIGLI